MHHASVQSNSELIAAYLDAVVCKVASVVDRSFAHRSGSGGSASIGLRGLFCRAPMARSVSRPGSS